MQTRTLPDTPATPTPDRPDTAPIAAEGYALPGGPRTVLAWQGFTRAETVALADHLTRPDAPLWGTPDTDPDTGAPWVTGSRTLTDGAGYCPSQGCSCRECHEGRRTLAARAPVTPDTPAALGEVHGPWPIAFRLVEGVQIPDGTDGVSSWDAANREVTLATPPGEVAAMLARLREAARAVEGERNRLRRDRQNADPEIAVDRALDAAGVHGAEITVDHDGDTVTITVEGATLADDGDFAPVENDYRVSIGFAAELSALVGATDADDAPGVLADQLGISLAEGDTVELDVEGWHTVATVGSVDVTGDDAAEVIAGVYRVTATVHAVTEHEGTYRDAEDAAEGAASDCCAREGKAYYAVGGVDGITATVTSTPDYDCEVVA